MEKDGESYRETFFLRARRKSQRIKREIGRKSKGIKIHLFGFEN